MTTIESLTTTIEDLQRALDRLAAEGRLKCVVDGKTTNDGRPAPLCPEIISDPRLMCAGCAASLLVDNDPKAGE